MKSAAGKAFILRNKRKNTERKFSTEDNEKARLDNAIRQYTEELKHNDDETNIAEGYISLLNDEVVLSRIQEKIREKSAAEDALSFVLNEYSDILSSSSDERMRQRAEDISNIKNEIADILTNEKSVDIATLPDNTILVCERITPAMVLQMNGNIVGVVCKNGGTLSHSAVLLRSKKIPFVFGAETENIKQGENLIIYENEDTFCTKKNLEFVRTEFFFMKRKSLPTEQEQLLEYSSLANQRHEVVIRTLDIGGDKQLDYLSPSSLRGIAFCLKYKDIFKTQLRAILRANTKGNIKILLPYVSDCGEIKMAKALIDECGMELEREGKAYKKAPVGIMIETPSAAILSDLLAKEADFFSIGTNDLTALTMGVSREETVFTKLPNAVIRLIEITEKNADAAGVPVFFCG